MCAACVWRNHPNNGFKLLTVRLRSHQTASAVRRADRSHCACSTRHTEQKPACLVNHTAFLHPTSMPHNNGKGTHRNKGNGEQHNNGKGTHRNEGKGKHHNEGNGKHRNNGNGTPRASSACPPPSTPTLKRGASAAGSLARASGRMSEIRCWTASLFGGCSKLPTKSTPARASQGAGPTFGV